MSYLSLIPILVAFVMMLPKVEAAIKFARTKPERKAIITSLDNAVKALKGETGTCIYG